MHNAYYPSSSQGRLIAHAFVVDRGLAPKARRVATASGAHQFTAATPAPVSWQAAVQLVLMPGITLPRFECVGELADDDEAVHIFGLPWPLADALPAPPPLFHLIVSKPPKRPKKSIVSKGKRRRIPSHGRRPPS